MNFYIPFEQPLTGGNSCVPQISTLVIINPSRVDYPYWLTLFRGQISSTQQLLLPDFNDKVLGEFVY